MRDHPATVTTVASDFGGARYQATCTGCNWKGRAYPADKRQLAEDDIERHRAYTASVARLTERAAQYQPPCRRSHGSGERSSGER